MLSDSDPRRDARAPRAPRAPSPRLSAFFDAMRGALRGELDAAELEARCGPSSDRARLARVVRMVHAGRARILRELYVATRHALGEQRFDAALRAHLGRERGAEADYAALALGFPETLRARETPAWVVEVADWEEALHRLRVVGAPAPRGAVKGPAIVRRYTFDVPGWVRDARQGERPLEPAPAPTTVLLHRAPASGRPRWLFPGAAERAALADGWGELDAAAREAIGPAILEAGRATLRRRGLL